MRYTSELVAVTREPDQYLPQQLARLIEYGASPRATIAFCKAARALAMLSGRDHVMPDDIDDWHTVCCGTDSSWASRRSPERCYSGSVDRQHHCGRSNPVTAMGVLLQEVKAQTLAGNRLSGPNGVSRGLLEGEHQVDVPRCGAGVRRSAPYVPGDDVRDIDWKASARSSDVLVKRFVSYRQQRVLMVVDLGRNMLALADGGEVKQRVVLNAVGLVGLIAISKGDEMGLVYGDATGSAHMPNRRGEAHLEHILERVNRHQVADSDRSDIAMQLEYVQHHFRRRHIVFVISDEPDVSPRLDEQFGKVAARHDVYWVTVRDAPLMGVPAFGGEGYDVVSGKTLLREEILGHRVLEAYRRAEARREADFEQYVNGSAIPCARISAVPSCSTPSR